MDDITVNHMTLLPCYSGKTALVGIDSNESLINFTIQNSFNAYLEVKFCLTRVRVNTFCSCLIIHFSMIINFLDRYVRRSLKSGYKTSLKSRFSATKILLMFRFSATKILLMARFSATKNFACDEVFSP